MTTVTTYPGIRGKRADGQIVEGIVPQFDGSSMGGQNCGASSEAQRVISQQQGKRPSKGSPWYPTGKSIRAETGDTVGGLTPSQTTRAEYAEYGVPYAAPRIDDFAKVIDKLKAGYYVDLLLQYGPIDDSLSGSPGFRGAHRGGLSGYTSEDGGMLLWADPLYDGRRSGIPRGPKWIPISVIRKAAGLLKLDSSGETVNDRYGAGHAYFIPSLVKWAPPVVIPPPTVTPAPPAPKEKNAMIASAYEVTSGRVMRLAQSQPLFRHPGGPIVTKMAREGDVAYLGHAGGSGDDAWGLVIVVTNNPYDDGVSRPTGLYVPIKAGPIRDR